MSHTAHPPPVTALRSPSPLQQQVLEFVEQGTGHGVVEATAGSGKTTTLVQVAQTLPVNQAACFLAFNRSTAAELRQRLPKHVEATTIHALGRAMLVGHLPHLASASPDGSKYRRLALGLVKQRMPVNPQPETLADYLAKLADFCRLALVGGQLTGVPDSNLGAGAQCGSKGAEASNGGNRSVTQVAERHQLQSPVTAKETLHLQALLPDLLAMGLEDVKAGRMDYTDMLFATLEFGIQPPLYGFVCVDEAQDLSPLTLALVMSLVAAGARALFVGDPKQAIYAFAGADSRSIQRITADTSATVLPLSVSFRCPTRHVLLARRFSPAMQAAPGATAGVVTITLANRLAKSVRAGDLVMCRVNAPLVHLALDIAEAGTPVRVLGTDLAGTALSLAQYLFENSLPHNAIEVVERNQAAEQRRLEETLLTSPALAEVLDISQHRHRALKLLLRHAGSVGSDWLKQLQDVAQALLGGQASGSSPGSAVFDAAVLSTIHKAKGREADRTFLLYPEELVPHAPTSPALHSIDAQAGQSTSEASIEDEAEANVLFVGLTRARQELVLVERHKRAVANRVTQFRHSTALKQPTKQPSDSQSGELLARQWSQVLSLALLMSEQGRQRSPNWLRRASTGLSSRHETAR